MDSFFFIFFYALIDFLMHIPGCVMYIFASADCIMHIFAFADCVVHIVAFADCDLLFLMVGKYFI